VAYSNSPSIITIKLQPRASRVLLLLPALLVVLGAWFVVRWYVGDTVAEYASTNESGAIELARLAARWAPGDPFVHWQLGALAGKDFSASNLAEAVRECKTAVSLSPNDYRYWGELGRALEASGDIEGGERAMRRAVELAPAYSYPRWYFGNLLLRQGKVDEAFQELARAAETDSQLRPQVFNLAWQVFGGDVEAIARAACPSPIVRVQFAIYLVGRQRFDEAMKLWTNTDPADRREQNALGQELKKLLFEAAQFHAALDVLRDIERDDSQLPRPEQFLNGGFESEVALPGAKNFGWLISSGPPAQMSIDNRAHSGHGSLRIIFKAPNKLDTIHVSQTIVVEPNTQYHFECYARTEKLNSGSTPVVTIRDAADNSALAASQPLPTGTNDWQRIAFDFKTKPKRDGVIVELGRSSCGEAPVCPIFGTVWYDDFNIQRIGGSGSSRRVSGNGKR
jgi:tetratricopeptide (TPR) repeat protein